MMITARQQIIGCEDNDFALEALNGLIREYYSILPEAVDLDEITEWFYEKHPECHSAAWTLTFEYDDIDEKQKDKEIHKK